MKKIIVNSQNNLRLILKSEIMLCKSDNCYTTYYLVGGEEHIVCKSLVKVYSELDSSIFIKISQSFLVNVNYIKSVDKKNKVLELQNNRCVPFTINISSLIEFINMVYTPKCK